MIHVTAVTIGDKEAASTKFRLIQYESYLRQQDIYFDFIQKENVKRTVVKALNKGGLLINQKCLFKHSISKQLLRRFDRTIFDFDDAIYTRPGKPYSFFTSMRVRARLAFWLRNADIITTSSNYLAGYAGRYTDKIYIIPMSLDSKKWHPIEKNISGEDPLRIGWAGSPVNVPYVERLQHVLSKLKREFRVEIYMYGGRKPNFDFPFTYVPYGQDKELDFIQHLDIGLLPLINEEHVRGKSPIKAIQYFSCGIPVVGNAYGATREILTGDTAMIVEGENEWYEALKALIVNTGLRKKMGESGLKHFQENFEFEKFAKRWHDLISHPL